MVVRIPSGWAFLPHPLPPSVNLTRELLLAAEAARGALGEFVGQTRLLTNPNLILGPMAQREAVLSSRIEGTNTEVREVLMSQATAEPERDPNSDLAEVLNYLRALRFGQEWVEEHRPLNLSLIWGLHAELMRGARGQDKHPGQFRQTQVFIGDHVRGIEAARFVPPPPEHVPALMDNLVTFMGGEPSYGPLTDCAISHYQFEAIHPFEDGNGRLGRLLIPLQLLGAGVLDRPILYLSSYFEQHRDQYMERLQRVSMAGDWLGWVLFFLEAVRWQAQDARQRTARVLALHARYRELARALPKAALLAVDLAMERVYLTVSQVAEHAQVSYNTARAAVAALEQAGILRPYGRVRGVQLWEAAELLHEVYER